MKKKSFFAKNGVRFVDEALGPEPCILQRFRLFFVKKKLYSLDPLGTLQTRKRSSGARLVTILEVALLITQDVKKPVKSCSRWPQVPPSWLQIVHITHTQAHTH